MTASEPGFSTFKLYTTNNASATALASLVEMLTDGASPSERDEVWTKIMELFSPSSASGWIKLAKDGMIPPIVFKSLGFTKDDVEEVREALDEKTVNPLDRWKSLMDFDLLFVVSYRNAEEGTSAIKLRAEQKSTAYYDRFVLDVAERVSPDVVDDLKKAGKKDLKEMMEASEKQMEKLQSSLAAESDKKKKKTLEKKIKKLDTEMEKLKPAKKAFERLLESKWEPDMAAKPTRLTLIELVAQMHDNGLLVVDEEELRSALERGMTEEEAIKRSVSTTWTPFNRTAILRAFGLLTDLDVVVGVYNEAQDMLNAEGALEEKISFREVPLTAKFGGHLAAALRNALPSFEIPTFDYFAKYKKERRSERASSAAPAVIMLDATTENVRRMLENFYVIDGQLERGLDLHEELLELRRNTVFNEDEEEDEDDDDFEDGGEEEEEDEGEDEEDNEDDIF